MKVVYRYSFRESECDRAKLQAMHLQYKIDELPPILGRQPSPIVRVYIDSSSHDFDVAKNFLEKLDNSPYVTTVFSPAEISNAARLDLGPSWHHGYPMPDDGGYKDLTYDRSEGCSKCGIGWIQKAPFRMKMEPKWGKRHIMQLNWVFDEYFVKPEVYETVFEGFGVSQRPVLHYQTLEPLKGVVQLCIDHVSSAPLAEDRLVSQACPVCGAIKYLPHTRGFFPGFKAPVDVPIVKAQEYFGSGGSAWRPIIVDSSVYQAIKESKLKGVDFTPLE